MKKKLYVLKIDIYSVECPEKQLITSRWITRREVAEHLRAAATDFEASDNLGRTGLELDWKRAEALGRKLGSKAFRAKMRKDEAKYLKKTFGRRRSLQKTSLKNNPQHKHTNKIK